MSLAGQMTPLDFIHTWKRSQLSERSGAQQHFLDLCTLLGQPTLAQADPEKGDAFAPFRVLDL